MLACGIQVDLRVVPQESFGAALHYFTGSKAHNIAIRKLGQARGLKINEYGVFKGKRRIAGETEASVYAAVGLPEIPPELREDQGEIEAARRGALPRLVERSDLQGDLHAHTKATDGRNTLREMAEAARARGLRYLAITEHSRRVTMAHGLDPQRLAEADRPDRSPEPGAARHHAAEGHRGRHPRGRRARPAGLDPGAPRPGDRRGAQQVRPVARAADRAPAGGHGAAVPFASLRIPPGA